MLSWICLPQMGYWERGWFIFVGLRSWAHGQAQGLALMKQSNEMCSLLNMASLMSSRPKLLLQARRKKESRFQISLTRLFLLPYQDSLTWNVFHLEDINLKGRLSLVGSGPITLKQLPCVRFHKQAGTFSSITPLNWSSTVLLIWLEESCWS